MANLHHKIGVLAGLALASCAAPKATVVQEVRAEPKQEVVAKAPEPKVPEPEKVAEVPQESGLRMPNMLEMPGDGEFRPLNPPAARAGAVISRPPTEPPTRVKPTEDPASGQR